MLPDQSMSVFGCGSYQTMGRIYLMDILLRLLRNGQYRTVLIVLFPYWEFMYVDTLTMHILCLNPKALK